MSPESFELPPDDLDAPRPRRRHWLRTVVSVIVLVLVGIGGAHAWVNAENLMRLLPWRMTSASTAGSDAKAILTDLMAAQRKASDDLAALQRVQAEQQDLLTAISGHLSELAAKMDALQNAAAASRTASPNVAAQPTSPAAATTAPVPGRAVAPKPRPPARSASPSGPISVGGGPLNPKLTQ